MMALIPFGPPFRPQLFYWSKAMKAAAQAGSSGDMESWRDETTVLHGDSGLTADSAVVPPIHYSATRSEEHTSELQSLMRISYAVFCLKKKNTKTCIKYRT